ncbi:PA2778 family cysteine peptidase [Pseudomonas citronellolis]|uniref:PA2778 family cysteine peptidase n=1 Tax=Pseudomonas citronellolis TaxID=53408 RepID=UPI0023E3B62C|nr:PA2778 family cysteine peptidase [Pseudomonas citronellolis]MDF3931075.1 PA2778 family cysteine peptidase [Pseudomonas citronellolis]
MRRGALALAVAAILLGGCARAPQLPPEIDALPSRVELSDVQFFPQQEFQCGPAALATLLNQRGVRVTPNQLKERVYLPGREGSLQVELVAAARERGLLVYPLRPRLDDVLKEVAAGNPVLVLQNNGLDWLPMWHYAVVVGFDRDRHELVLRSGITQRLVIDFTAFDVTWARSGRWAVLALPSERLPASVEPTRWLRAAHDLEETGQRPVAEQAYRSATRAWPRDPLGWFALGNSRYAAGNLDDAEAALRRSVEVRADFAAGWYNLGNVLAERGCAAQADSAASCARQLAPDDRRFAAPLSAGAARGQCAAVPACPAR